jgi:hypothetical protein
MSFAVGRRWTRSLESRRLPGGAGCIGWTRCRLGTPLEGPGGTTEEPQRADGGLDDESEDRIAGVGVGCGRSCVG